MLSSGILAKNLEIPSLPTHTTVLCCYVVLLGVLSMDGVVDVGKCGSHRVSGTTNCRATEEEEDMDDLKKSETWRQW